MMLQRPPNPVQQDYGGGETFNPRHLKQYCDAMNGNLTYIETALFDVNRLLKQERRLNEQLVDFATWVVAQNPKALHEYKSMATVLTGLEGRDNEDKIYPQSTTT